MTINGRKMNNYSLMRVSTTFIFTIVLVVSTISIPFGHRTGAEPIDNNPPYVPSNPEPSNGSTNVYISVDLNWTGGDPDGDPVIYDVYFGTTSPPELVATNQSDPTYDPGAMNYSTTYYWIIVAWDNQSASTKGPEWVFTTEQQVNNPPNVPSSPIPSNGSMNVTLDVILHWVGGDPDVGDIVLYDVYFGNTSTPSKIADNLSTTSYDPLLPLEYNTQYYWRIVSWDNHNTSTIGPLWHFTTKQQQGSITVTIIKPQENKFYFNDMEQSISLSRNSIVYGKITITVNVTSDNEITNVEFFVDGKPIQDKDPSTPYTCEWQPIIQFNSALSLTRTIKVVVHDSENNSASAEINITKWRFHALPFIIAGLGLASRLVLHTTVSGLFFNFQQSRFSVSFYAFRARFKTIGPFKSQRGVLNFKSCMGGMIIGPMKLTSFGLFHKFSYGSFTFIGNLHADKVGLGQVLLSGLLQRRTGNNGGGLLNLFSALKS
jgi:hypothetical protein